MSSCLVHPERPAAGACELCAQPHCAACLRTLLGRTYCPSCYAEVHVLATGRRAPDAVPPAGIAGPAGGSVAGPRTVLPGWASGLLYLVAFILIYGLCQFLTMGVLGVARALRNPGLGRRIFDDALFLDPAGLGVPLWALLLGLGAWLSLAVVLALSGVWVRFVERAGFRDLGLAWTRTSLRDALLGIGLAVALFVSVVGIGLSRDAFSIRPPVSLGQSLLTVLGGFLVLLPFAAVEEVATRGVLMRALGRSWGAWGALLASSAVFTALHGANPSIAKNPLALVGLFLAGLYLGSAFLVTRSLWLPVLLHTSWNLVQGPVFGLPVSGIRLPVSVFQTTPTGPDLWTGGDFGPEGGLLLCLLTAVHLSVIWVLRPALQPREPAPVLQPSS